MRHSLNFLLALVVTFIPIAKVHAQRANETVSAREVLTAIDKAKRFLVSTQNGDGSWGEGRFIIGSSALSLVALLNAGMTTDDQTVQRGLAYLRKQTNINMTYEISLTLMAFAAAKDGTRDYAQMVKLARRLEGGQLDQGDNAGSWTYSVEKGSLLNLGGDRSNGQFALLGLREAAHAGVPVKRSTWLKAKEHWRGSQNGDGGWAYSGKASGGSYGSMTAAGISSLVITEAMLRETEDGDGEIDCCSPSKPDAGLERAVEWMGKHFRRGINPGKESWLLYYLYGIERAGRLSGRRFFGDHDWYREIAAYLVGMQNKRLGSFRGVGSIEAEPHVGTPLALLFLSKGLAPVLINKLEYGPEDNKKPSGIANKNWNQKENDARNMVEHISGLKKWPALLTFQTVNVKKVFQSGGVEDLLQSPVLYITGQDAPYFNDDELELLKEYVNQGGFIFAAGNCDGGFDDGFRDLIKRMYPDDGIQLKPLEANHPIFRSEYLLGADSVPLEGADFGCRTAIVLAPSIMKLPCLWDAWSVSHPPKRRQEVKLMIGKGMKVGVNVIAYATGREPPKKLDPETQLVNTDRQDAIDRGLLQVAKLRHGGGWDTAPQALQNLLAHLNQAVGTVASSEQRNLIATDPNLFKYPLLYMHGRGSFRMTKAEQEKIRDYLQNGGVLFADSCCGSKNFDSSFRKLVAELFPERKLQQIPVSQEPGESHELFTTTIGYDIRMVKRRSPEIDSPDVAIEADVKTAPPLLEGIEIDGRYAVIYSKLDISCALQRQANVACKGYVPEDAAKIASNVVLYAMLQDVGKWFPEEK